MASHNSRCSDEEFMRLFRENGATETARILNLAVRRVFDRRKRLERSHDTVLVSPCTLGPDQDRFPPDYPIRRHVELRDGILMSISDVHLYPGYVPTASRAFLLLAGRLKPKAVLLNGDVLDFPKISRHAPIGWANKPSVQEELECVSEWETALRKTVQGAKLYWNMGNHDMRFENRLAEASPEYRGVAGTRLGDHFPHWDIGISTWFNQDLVTKHRFKGGIHATHNNTLWAGKSILTGHLHSLKVTPFDDYNGTRYGIDSGTGNDPHGPHTDYVEDNPLNHRSGFIIITFVAGKMLWPEIVAVVDKNHVQFRGELIQV